MKKLSLISAAAIALVTVIYLLIACDDDDTGASANLSDGSQNLRAKTLINNTAYIPSQCYTKTEDDNGGVHNPCFSCHTASEMPNFVNDAALQLGFDFPAYATENHWTNLFEDRSSAVAAISDDHILDYVRSGNYFDENGAITLAQQLANPPQGWDFDDDGQWAGYVPDIYFNFDNEGFDRSPEGGYTGWRAFAYTPFPGTFWPTNGSTDDVIIRLGAPFRHNSEGQFDLVLYKINLAIVETLIRRDDVTIAPIDENRVGVDLNKNGIFDTADQVVFDWAPLEDRFMSYVGMAKIKQDSGEIHLAAGLFPEGTAFLHTVRYIDVTESGDIALAPRLKELRYGKKKSWASYNDLRQLAADEGAEAHNFPDRLREVFGNVEEGVSNDQGWVYQGFIEDADGNLRPQTYEETVFCIGCHSTIGATTDGVFAFPRKLDSGSFQDGWFHWSQRGLADIPEPTRRDGEYEYSYYLEHNHAGDEFRNNDEIIAKFFDESGNLGPEALEQLHNDISYLLFPSPERAIKLNKAYKVIVEQQSFAYGRDANVEPVKNVHQQVEQGQLTGIDSVILGR